MSKRRAHVLLPDDLLNDIDDLVGPRGRTAFLTEVLRQEVNRRRLLQFLNSSEPILKEDYPEFKDGADVWVRRMRDQDTRLQREKLGEWLNSAHDEKA